MHHAFDGYFVFSPFKYGKGIPVQAVTSGSTAYLKMMRSQD
ncbi:hypothetical protein [Paucilactobacillus nenjiangensis]